MCCCRGVEALKLSFDSNDFVTIDGVVNGVVSVFALDDVIDRCVVVEIEMSLNLLLTVMILSLLMVLLMVLSQFLHLLMLLIDVLLQRLRGF